MTTNPLHDVIVGPSKSRRFGNFIAVNPVPSADLDNEPAHADIESSDETGPTISRLHQVPSAGIVVTTAARHLIEHSKAGDKMESIVVAGRRDPTLHPSLLEITENLRDLRNKWYPKAKLCLLTDSKYLTAPGLRHALMIYDKPIARFEWATAKSFNSLTGRPGTELKRVVERIRGLDKLIIEATFAKGSVDNSTAKEVAGWIKKLEEIRPKRVEITTVEASKTRGAPKPVTDKRLAEIAAEVSDKLGLECDVLTLEPQLV